MRFPDSMSLGYLEDHDEVLLEAWCGEAGDGIGFGECRGTLLPASKRGYFKLYRVLIVD